MGFEGQPQSRKFKSSRNLKKYSNIRYRKLIGQQNIVGHTFSFCYREREAEELYI